MPTWDKVIKEYDSLQSSYLNKAIRRLHALTKRTTILYATAFQQIRQPPVPPPLHSIIDADMQGFMTCAKGVDKSSLDLILHTPGGALEATKEIINYLRSIYKEIRVIVPIKAMSGGTMIACAADKILMGPYSHLGPTDPQILIGGAYVPVGAIIDEFKFAFEQVRKDPRSALIWQHKLAQIPVGLYRSAITMMENSKKYLHNLLKNYALKDSSDPDERARMIAEALNSSDRFSSHGEGLSIKRLNELGLSVDDLHEDRDLEERVLTVYHICSRLFQTSNVQKIIINHKGVGQTISYNPPPK